MKKYPLLCILIISSLLVTLPGLLLNSGLVKTSESDNYSFKKTAASSTIHELKTISTRLWGKITRSDSPASIEGAVPYAIPGQSAPVRHDTTVSGQSGINDLAEDPGDKAAKEGTDASDGEDENGQEGSPDEVSENAVAEEDPLHPDFKTVDDSYFLDACFIGDSRTKGFGMYSGLTTTVYAKVGFQLYKVFEDRIVETPYGKLTVPEALGSGVQFNKIYLMFGLNEMGWGNDEQFMEYYYYLIDAVKALQPQAVIYVQQIIHVTKKKAESSPVFNNAAIDHRNELLRKVAADEHVYYLELNEVFTDEEGNLPAEYSFDGVHFGADSMKIWKDYLETHAIVRDSWEQPTEVPSLVSADQAPEPAEGENPEQSTEGGEPEQSPGGEVEPAPESVESPQQPAPEQPAQDAVVQ